MAFINPAVVEAARVVVRQAAETALTTAISVTAPPGPTSPGAASSPPVTAVTLSTAAPSPTDSSTLANGDPNAGGGNSGGGNGGGNGGGGNSSSLLFFVALGFGVVFTNLWIIVGVKYCFRYNARARQMRNEEGEPINMENMPRPHRRRREKKLMPIDEVNEKFPMLKYKTWVASRAQEGLPTRGGVSVPQSRPNSVRDADGVVTEFPPKERMSTEDRPTTSATATGTATEPASDAAPENAEKPKVQSPQHAPKESTSSTVAGLPRASTESNREPETTVAHKHLSQISHDDDDEDEHIDAALPPACLGTAGDTCAICIDTLEDDDDVRGLTCGHAFHAVCIDPWLTTRRACCPLCKADYFTPKPRPQAGEGGDGTAGVVHVTVPDNSRSSRMNLPGRPRPTFFGFARTDRTNDNSRPTVSRSRPRDTGGSSIPGRRRSRPSATPSSLDAIGRPRAGGLLSGLRNAFPGFRAGRGQNNQTQSDPPAAGANPAVTPSQLEAGVRNPQS
ncbi:hypothetical protein C8A01DRAFT_35956 [Parachaetomium inaequale]|uniref:RING-type domain-containing protein n=1 Tax=Parachaetomium inaequale TaxID=2588326 RepID=A0AAN6PG40_9PEZI|nr:hypothetical protein C8A01DRAFT_35956 [Parachaetomium inaequale]